MSEPPPAKTDQHGQNNFGYVDAIKLITGDDVDGDKIGGDKIGGNKFVFYEISPGETAESLMKARLQIWHDQVDKLCEKQLKLSVEAIVYTLLAVWDMSQTVDMETKLPFVLFREIVHKHCADRPTDIDSLLVFVCALARFKLLNANIKQRLQTWVERTIKRLSKIPNPEALDAQEITMRADDIAAQAERYAHEPFSLLIAVAPSRNDRYTLQVRIFHPADFEANPLDSTAADFTADEVRQELNMIRHKLPSWIRSSEGGMLFEFLLPFDLLAELEAGAWQFTNWLFKVDQHPASADLPLGQLHPILARCFDRWPDEVHQWERRWRQFERWLSNPQPELAPLLTCLRDDHARYVCYEAWKTESRLLGVVIDALPEPAAQRDSPFKKILEAGLPVALWPAPRPEGAVLPATYSEAILQDQSVRLGNLPKEIWERRRNSATAHEVAGLVLFWDNFDRQPQRVPFEAPQ